jgi:putative addiction module CopG family antidote
MQIELTPAQNSFIQLGIREGRFRDSDEAVREALAQWEKRERARVELLTSLDLAEHSLDAGEGEEYTVDNLNELVESVKKRGIARLAGQDGSEFQHIRAGLVELDADQGIANEHVKEWLDSWGTDSELPAPQ